MAKRVVFCVLSCATALGLAGCGGDRVEGSSEGPGRLEAALSSASPHDVAAIRYAVLAADQTCADAPLVEVIAPMESETLTSTVQAPGGGNAHLFADALFTLEPGDYRVCAFPLTADGGPSVECGAAEAVGTVSPSATTEIVLVSQCGGVASGALDAVTVLNDPPVIDALAIRPSKFVATCEDATLTASATDPNGDEVSFAWSVVTGDASLTATGNTATFQATEPGDYELQVSAIDVYGGVTTLTVPMHVTGDSCSNVFCNPIGYDACPSGAVEWCASDPISPASSEQARLACEACYGAPCYLESADCAGEAWGPRPAGTFVCGEAYFGFQQGCSGDDGRTWPICNSFDTFGHWGRP